MEAASSIFQINDIIVYSVYGQVFFCLGLAVAFHSHYRSRLELSRHLLWLAAFGFSHGLHEWGHVFIPIQANYLSEFSVVLLNAARVALLALSFFFLGQFGAGVAFSDGRVRISTRIVFAGLLVASLGWSWTLLDGSASSMFVIAEAWVRRALGFPAAILAALGMMRQARLLVKAGFSGITADLGVAAVSFGSYGLLAGLAVPAEDLAAAYGSLHGLPVHILGIPAPVLRSIAGLGIVYGVVRGLRILKIEADRRLEEAERARLQAAQRARSAMEAMAATISEHHHPARLLEAALDQILVLSGSKLGWLMLADETTGSVELQTSGGLGPIAPRKEACRVELGCACQAALRAKGAVVFRPGTSCRLWATDALAEGWLGVPLVAHGRPIGVAHLAGAEFSAEMSALLVSLGKQLALALENARLAQAVSSKEAARAQLLKKVITAQEEERRRIARDLHDHTGQSLTAVIMALGAARERMPKSSKRVTTMLDEAREVAVRALEETRKLILGLRPASLDDLGLVPALRRLAEDLARTGNLEISVESNGLSRRLPGDVETAAFRVVQESLNNVLRHSRARHAAVRLTCVGGQVRVEVSDDGVGFDLLGTTSPPESGWRLGLLGMKERAALLGGELMVETSPGKGTHVMVTIPLSQMSQNSGES